MLRLHDTATGRVEALEPTGEGPTGLYVCGPTVYGPPHVGHGRLSLVFDVVRRWLEHRGIELHHVENVTDLDDKIIDRALREDRPYEEVAAEAEAQWWEAMDRLGNLRPHATPHATEWIGEIVELVSRLVEAGAAYETSDGVYLDTSTVPDYGLLKHQDLDSLRAGARVALSEEKRTPFDFVLWKAAKPDEPSWPSPFGAGRPGWHSECVAMSLGLLGEGFELHGGGADLIFPHHEDERAQAVALGRRFARRWLHSGLVTVGDEKMSKSLGNVTNLEQLFERVDPRAFRLLVLRSHYRSPLEAGEETFEDAARSLARLDALARRVEEVEAAGAVEEVEVARAGRAGRAAGAAEEARSAGTIGAAGPSHEERSEVDALEARFGEAMDDDLDTPRATAALFSAARRANALLDEPGAVPLGLALARAALGAFAVLGLSTGSAAGTELAPDEVALGKLRARDAARARGDFAAADQLRDELAGLGWRVEDGAGGSRLRRARS